VPYVVDRPDLPAGDVPAVPMSGNFAFREDFDSDVLDPYWLFVRIPQTQWYDLESEPGTLVIEARPDSIGGFAQPSYIGRRQQHMHASASTALRYQPAHAGDTAGLAAFQNDEYYYYLGVALGPDGRTRIELRKRAGASDPVDGVVLESAPLDVEDGATVYLRVDARGALYDFYYAVEEDRWMPLATDADGKILSTRTAGGFVGTTFGMYAKSGKH
jgi:xylan 1,4-beta-xylosidase